jgi:hypothetical protein
VCNGDGTSCNVCTSTSIAQERMVLDNRASSARTMAIQLARLVAKTGRGGKQPTDAIARIEEAYGSAWIAA